MAKAVFVPLAIAAATFVGLVAYDHVADLGESVGQGRPDGFKYAFQQVVVPDDQSNATVLLLSRDEQALGLDGRTDWRTPHVATQPTSPYIASCLSQWPCALTHQVAAAAAPRLGVDGHNATRVVVHAFDAGGALVLSNGNASEQARLVDKLSPDQLPRGVWYLGANATPPNGTQRPPFYAAFLIEQLRPQLHGQPVGGVVTFETDALATYYGRLYVTLQVRELVHAP